MEPWNEQSTSGPFFGALKIVASSASKFLHYKNSSGRRCLNDTKNNDTIHYKLKTEHKDDSKDKGERRGETGETKGRKEATRSGEEPRLLCLAVFFSIPKKRAQRFY